MRCVSPTPNFLTNRPGGQLQIELKSSTTPQRSWVVIELLTLLAASEGGKTYKDSKVDVVRTIDGVRLCAETLRAHPGSVIPTGRTKTTSGKLALRRYWNLTTLSIRNAWYESDRHDAFPGADRRSR